MIYNIDRFDDEIARTLAERGEARLNQDGYRRAKWTRRARQILAHSWSDHAVCLRKTDGRRAYLIEPYGLNLNSLKSIVRVAEEFNLDVTLWQHYGAWNPKSTTVVMLIERLEKVAPKSVRRFVEQRCELDSSLATPSSVLYRNYAVHCIRVGDDHLSLPAFTRALKLYGIERTRDVTGYTITHAITRARQYLYAGVRLRAS